MFVREHKVEAKREVEKCGRNLNLRKVAVFSGHFGCFGGESLNKLKHQRPGEVFWYKLPPDCFTKQLYADEIPRDQGASSK